MVAHSVANSEPCNRCPKITDLALTDRITTQARVPVRAIEALGTIQPSGPFERALARLLMVAYQRRLRAIAAATPVWVSEETLRVGAHSGR